MILGRNGDALDQIAGRVTELGAFLVSSADSEPDASISTGEHFAKRHAHILSLVVGYARGVRRHVEGVDLDDGVVVPVELQFGEPGFKSADDYARDVLPF